MASVFIPERIRVSTGSAIVLGLLRSKLDAKPTTVYLLTCRKEKCSANCGFCPQARDSEGRADMLSRVTWPTFRTRQVVDRIERAVRSGAIKRVCIQTLNYPQVFDEVLLLVGEIKARVAVPISVSCQPLNPEKMKRLADVGVNRISVALDAATEEIFDSVKGRNMGGPYRWERQREALLAAVRVFGEGSVSTHLIVGLGETEKEMCQTIQWCVDSGVYPGLFAFTPIPGTVLEDNPPPSLSSYRRVQVAHYLLTHRKARFENMPFDSNGCLIDFGIPKERLRKVIDTGEPFLTSGCPGCNRPYYNERPGCPLYNYPRQLLPEEIMEAKRTLGF
ncbi:MAG TPA: radical SAM protein [Candidatus Bathyarchaeota archaeon]|nr:radical SAM protein [Candidatus Bathyarchaeota archaeon]